jgi:hypothetical protein
MQIVILVATGLAALIVWLADPKGYLSLPVAVVAAGLGLAGMLTPFVYIAALIALAKRVLHSCVDNDISTPFG